MGMNKTLLEGRLTKDVELRYTPNGTAVANGTIAVPRDYKDDEGNNPADFLQFVVWDKKAENLANYTAKGDMISLVGRLESRSYENNEGMKVFVTEINVETFYFLQQVEKENSSQNQNSNGNQRNNQRQQGQQRNQRQGNRR
jgi:single-strand DNA-binding protein